MVAQFVVVCLLLNSVRAFQDAPAYQIMKKLFSNDTYKISRNVLPSPQPNNTPVVITLQLALHQILDLDEKNEIIKLNFWLIAVWNNPYLKWNAEEYGGVKTMIVETTKVWTPDLTLWNRAVEQESLYERMEKRIRINNDGDCRWKSLITTTSSCTIAVRNFPFDEQSCELQFGSWHYPSNELKFRLENDTCIVLTYFTGNREWKVIDTSSKVQQESFKQNGYFDVIYCSLTVHRNAMFYIVNMILPCAIICFLGCLAFLLPPSNGERVSIVVTVLLSINVYMLIVAEYMPAAANEIPLVDKFFIVCIFETSLCLIGTCFVVRWNDATGPMPWWIYFVFNCIMPKILFVKHERNISEVPENAQINQTDTALPFFEMLAKENKEKENRQEDWPLAAKALNKFLFFFFTILFFVTGILIINQL